MVIGLLMSRPVSWNFYKLIFRIISKKIAFMTKWCSKLLLVLGTLYLQGCPYIAHDSSDAPELVTAEDVQGCYYSELIDEDIYVDRKLPNVEGEYPAQGREKRFDRILCKEVCVEGDSATVVVRGFALTYDITGQFVEDTIPYTLKGVTITYRDDVEVHTIRESEDTVSRERFPVFFLKPMEDGVFHTNIMTNFPVNLYTDKPTYHTGSFEMNASSILRDGVFSRDGTYRKLTVEIDESEEIFSTKGWDVCKGF